MASNRLKHSKEPRDRKTPAEIHRLYSNGEWNVPCIQVQCIRFNQAMYDELCSNGGRKSPKRKETSSAATSYRSVRRRVSTQGPTNDLGASGSNSGLTRRSNHSAQRQTRVGDSDDEIDQLSESE
jgi:hypothetical protein